MAQSNWHIWHAQDEDSTFFTLNQAEKEKVSIEVIALDLGLPPKAEDPIRSGIPLAQKLRQYDDELPILAYTGFSPKRVRFDLLLAKLLPLRISFVALRLLGNETTIAELLELAWKGFVFQSPETSAYLPKAVSLRPDPLLDFEWDTLKLLYDQELTQKQIAAQLFITTEAVKTRQKKISDRLIEFDNLASEKLSRQELARWYYEHYVQYCRY